MGFDCSAARCSRRVCFAAAALRAVKLFISHSRDVAGVVGISAAAATATQKLDDFWKHVGPLRVQKPAKSAFSISKGLETHADDRITTVEGLFLAGRNISRNATWEPPRDGTAVVVSRGGAAVAASAPPAPAPAQRNSVLHVHYGPWSATYADPKKAEWPTPGPPKP